MNHKLSEWTPRKMVGRILIGLIVIVAPGFSTLWANEASSRNSAGLNRRIYHVDDSFCCPLPSIAVDRSRRAFDVKEQLLAKGIAFGPGSSAVYVPSSKTLTFINDSAQIQFLNELVNDYTGGLHIGPGAHFVEINQVP